jgi:hypothetical protein
MGTLNPNGKLPCLNQREFGALGKRNGVIINSITSTPSIQLIHKVISNSWKLNSIQSIKELVFPKLGTQKVIHHLNIQY